MSAKAPAMSSSISLSTLNPDAIPRCSTHGKRLKFFCSKHDLLLCSVCAVKRHRTCEEVLTINEACEDKKSEGNKLLDSYNQKIALLENAIVERKAAKKLLETNAQEIQSEIHEVTEKIIDLVKHEERALLENVQTMKNRESETLDKDITGLEMTCSDVRKTHDTLSQSLKCSEVDLIHAVIKEKQKNNEDSEIESIVKKRFKEIDFKFIVSPHITSFLKHFKNLGQVMMSEDSGNMIRVPRSNMSTPVSEISVPVSRYHNDSMTSVRDQPSVEETHMSARERWARQRQMQSAGRESTSSNSSVFLPDQQPVIGQTRRNLPMRALPPARPETPEVYSRPSVQTQRRDFVQRPVSTPPTETSQAYAQNPKSRDVNRFNSTNKYKTTRPEPIYLSDRRSPAPMRAPPPSDNYESANSREDMHHSEPVYVFQRRTTSDSQSPNAERPPSPWASRTHSPPYQTSPHNSPPQHSPPQHSPPRHSPPLQQPSYSIVSVKDNDTNFGRSFAAVQINDHRMSPPNTSAEYSLHAYQSKATINVAPVGNRDRSPHSTGVSNIFTVYPNNNARQRVNSPEKYSPRLDESRGFTPSSSSPTPNEGKPLRWVQESSFNSNGIGSKRLISGICFLYDGRIVLVDQEHYTVQLYDNRYRFSSEYKLDSRPFDVAVIGENKIVVSLQSERALKFLLVTGEGLAYIADLGVPCNTVCYGLCRGGGNYCVCCGDEIWVLSEEGKVVNCLKEDKNGNALFALAEYVSVDSTGNILFVSDSVSNNVLAIYIDGRRLWEFTYQGFKPCGITCVEDYIYVCDRDQHRILMLDMTGKVVKQSIIGRLENPRALAFHNAATKLVVTQMKYDAITSPPRSIHVYMLQ